MTIDEFVRKLIPLIKDRCSRYLGDSKIEILEATGRVEPDGVDEEGPNCALHIDVKVLHGVELTEVTTFVALQRPEDFAEKPVEKPEVARPKHPGFDAPTEDLLAYIEHVRKWRATFSGHYMDMGEHKPGPCGICMCNDWIRGVEHELQKRSTQQ